MTFEGLNAALSLITEEYGLLDAARRAAAENPQSRLLQFRVSKARASLEEAKTTGYKLLADEVLPAIIDGEWRLTDNLNWLYGKERTFYSRPLFDHVRALRLGDAKGRNGWNNTVIVSNPYKGALTNGGKTISKETIEQARALTSDHGAVVWAQHDLSPYYPGQTSLVLISPLLRVRDPADFGFEAI